MACHRFETIDEFWEWEVVKFGLRFSRSTIYNFMDLARCVTTENYPKNFGLSALYEWTAPKYEAIRDEILSLLKDKERVNKQDVIEAAAMILLGGAVESADDSRESQTSPAATNSPILRIRRGRQKAHRYDLRSQDDAKSLLQFARELVSEYHDAAFVAECVRDVKKRPVVIDMDPQVDDADTDHVEIEESVSKDRTDIVVCQRARNSSPVIRNRQTTIRPRPITQ